MSNVSVFISVSTGKGNYWTRLTKVFILFFYCSLCIEVATVLLRTQLFIVAPLITCQTNPKPPVVSTSIFSPNPAKKQTCRFNPLPSPHVSNCKTLCCQFVDFPSCTVQHLWGYLMPINCCWILSPREVRTCCQHKVTLRWKQSLGHRWKRHSCINRWELKLLLTSQHSDRSVFICRGSKWGGYLVFL